MVGGRLVEVCGPTDGSFCDFLKTKIDDLAKFNVVDYLVQNPGMTASARYFAWRLGFCSIARTRVILNELANSGLVRKRRRHFDHEWVYSLSRDENTKQELERFCETARRSADKGELLAELAAQSVVRAAVDAGMVAN
jgi:hypothetical protein